jgi:hypothetical protein
MFTDPINNSIKVQVIASFKGRISQNKKAGLWNYNTFTYFTYINEVQMNVWRMEELNWNIWLYYFISHSFKAKVTTDYNIVCTIC